MTRCAVVMLANLLLVCADARTAFADTIYWFSPQSGRTLPAIDAGMNPDAVAQKYGAQETLPNKAGNYVFYQHGALWYWFGPYEDRSEASRQFAALRSKLIELKQLNPERYAEAHAARLTAKSDDAIPKLYRDNPNAIKLKALLDALDTLSEIELLEEGVKRLEEQKKADVAGRNAGQIDKELESLRTQLQYVALSASGYSDERAILGRLFGAGRAVLKDEADEARVNVAVQIARRQGFIVDLERYKRAGVLPSEARAMAEALRRGLKLIGASDRSATEALSELENIANAGVDKGRSSGAELVLALEKAGRGALQTTAIGQGLPSSSVNSILFEQEVGKLANGLKSAGFPEAGAALASAPVSTFGDENRTAKGVIAGPDIGLSFLGELLNAPTPADADAGARLLQSSPSSSAGTVDLDAARVYGLNPQAAQALGQTLVKTGTDEARAALLQTTKGPLKSADVAVAARKMNLNDESRRQLENEMRNGVTEADRGKMTQKLGELWATERLADGLESSLRTQLEGGAETRPEDAQNALNSYLKERGLEPGKSAANSTDQAVDNAARKLSAAILTSPDTKSAANDYTVGLTGSEVYDSLASVGRDGKARGGASGSPGDGKKTGGNAKGGKDGGSGRNQFGSGSLPLPGSMPAFELAARIVMEYFGIDANAAKQVLLAAYMVNPKQFEKIAADLESLHDDLVDANTAKTLNDVNTVWEIIDRAQGTFESLQANMDQILSGDMQPVLDMIQGEGTKALTDQGVKELAKKTGLSEKMIAALVQKPEDFDAERAKGVMTEMAKDEVKNELVRRGVSPDLAALAASGKFEEAANAGRAKLTTQATSYLAKAGLPPGAWQSIARGNWQSVGEYAGVGRSAALDSMVRERMSKGLEALKQEGTANIAKRLGLPPQTVEKLLEGEAKSSEPELRARLDAAIRESFRQRLRVLGVSPESIAAVQRGDQSAVAVLGQEFAQTALRNRLQRAGLGEGEVALVEQGSWASLEMGSEAEVSRRAKALATSLPLPPPALSFLKEGKAREVIRELGKPDHQLLFDRQVSRDLGLPGDLTFDQLKDPEFFQGQVSTVASSELATLNKYLSIGGRASLTEADPEDIRQMLFELGNKVGWAKVAQQLKMDEITLKRFAQSTSRVEEFGKVSRAVARRMEDVFSDRIYQLRLQALAARRQVDAITR